MSKGRGRELTELELDIMRVVWARDEASVKEIAEVLARAGRLLGFSSIRTMLGILRRKGHVTRRRVGRAFLYRTVVPEDQAKGRLLKNLIDRAFNGSARSLVATLVKGEMVSKKELDEAKRLIEQHEKGAE